MDTKSYCVLLKGSSSTYYGSEIKERVVSVYFQISQMLL